MQPFSGVTSPIGIQTPTIGVSSATLKKAWSWCQGFSRPRAGLTSAMSWKSAGVAPDQPLDQRHQGGLAGQVAERRLAVDETRELPHMPGAQLGIERRQAAALLAVDEAATAALRPRRHLAIVRSVKGQMVSQRALVPDHRAARRIGARHRLELGARRQHLGRRQQAAHHEEAVLAVALDRGVLPGIGRRHAVLEPLESVESGIMQRDLGLEEHAGLSRH